MRQTLIPAGFLFLTCVAFAAKQSDSYDVPSEAIGVSGSNGATSEGGLRLRYTVGAMGFSTRSSTSSVPPVVTPGIWAGAPTLNALSAEMVLRFGPTGYQGELVIPANALTQDYLLYSSTSPASRPLHVSPAVIAQARDNLDRGVSPYTRPDQEQVWELYLQEEDGQRAAATFQIPARLTLPFKDENNDGLMDGLSVPVRINTLAIWWLDEEHSRWTRLTNCTVNASSKTVTAPVSHLSVFAVMGAPALDPTASYAFPVPWRPAGGAAGTGPGQSGTYGGGITFTNLPDVATIRIYTLSGALVRELQHRSGPVEPFDVRSDSGDILATGTYPYVIESNGARKTGKLVIIR